MITVDNKGGKADPARRVANETTPPQVAAAPRSPKLKPEVISGTWLLDGDELVQTIAWTTPTDNVGNFRAN